MRCAHTDWVRNILRVTGPAETLEAFRAAARGCGATPWRIDYDRLEEDTIALMLLCPGRATSLEGVDKGRSHSLPGQFPERKALPREGCKLICKPKRKRRRVGG